ACGRLFRASLAPGTLAWFACADATPNVVGSPRGHLLPRTVRGRLAPRRTGTHMRHHAVTVILDPTPEERTIAPSLDTFLSVIKRDGGTVEKVDVWGRRRMAYEINHHAEGIYAVVDLHASPAAVQELDRQLNLNESVLRTKVLRP